MLARQVSHFTRSQVFRVAASPAIVVGIEIPACRTAIAVCYVVLVDVIGCAMQSVSIVLELL